MELSRGRHPDDEPLKSTLKQLQDFEEGVIWLDISTWIDERIDLLKDKLLTADTMPEIKGTQETIKQLQDLKMLPTWFIEQKEDELQRKQEEKNHG